MNWSSLPESVLLQRSFLFGICGILLGTLSLLNTQLRLLDAPMGPLNGVSLLLQFFGLGLAVVAVLPDVFRVCGDSFFNVRIEIRQTVTKKQRGLT